MTASVPVTGQNVSFVSENEASLSSKCTFGFLQKKIKNIWLKYTNKHEQKYKESNVIKSFNYPL